jgi:hypothetical protein
MRYALLVLLALSSPCAAQEGERAREAYELRLEMSFQLKVPHAVRSELHHKILDWLHLRSRNIVRRVDAAEFDPRAVSMRHWTAYGLSLFYQEFAATFPEVSDLVYVYARWHQGFLKYEAQRLGLWDEGVERAPLRRDPGIIAGR